MTDTDTALEDLLCATERAIITLPERHELRAGLWTIRRGLLLWLDQTEFLEDRSQ
jgi:hypothetical protein